MVKSFMILLWIHLERQITQNVMLHMNIMKIYSKINKFQYIHGIVMNTENENVLGSELNFYKMTCGYHYTTIKPGQ